VLKLYLDIFYPHQGFKVIARLEYCNPADDYDDRVKDRGSFITMLYPPYIKEMAKTYTDCVYDKESPVFVYIKKVRDNVIPL
jgi:hypothetical protein